MQIAEQIGIVPTLDIDTDPAGKFMK